MSFNLLIVDDEPIICKGLRYSIQWEKHNVQVTDVAYDGEEAIQKIKQNHIDIVITDVRMPNVDGLQLATFLYENYPTIRTIIISGYDEFRYAQKAIQLGVKDYLLKPVNISELMQKVDELTREMETEQHTVKELQQTDLQTIVLQQLSDTPIRKDNAYIKVYPFISMIQNYMNEIESLSAEGVQNLKLRWKNFIDDAIQQIGFETVSVFIDDNILLTCITMEETDFKRNDLYMRIMRKVRNEDFPLSFVWNHSIIPLVDLKETMDHLIHSIKYLAIKENENGIIYEDEMDRKMTPAYPHELEKKLIDAIFHFDREEISDVSKALFNYFELNGFFLEEVQQICNEMLIKVVNQYEILRGKKVDRLDRHLKQSVNVRLFNSYSLIQKLFEEDINTMIEQLHLNTMDKRNWLIWRAEEYIKRYYKSNIKVHEVADVMNISPNYFRTLFKQQTGKSFSEYVNQLRIEEAKKLLVETPFKVSEISEQVGFREYKYFVEIFKRYSGMTPTNYRKLMTID